MISLSYKICMGGVTEQMGETGTISILGNCRMWSRVSICQDSEVKMYLAVTLESLDCLHGYYLLIRDSL